MSGLEADLVAWGSDPAHGVRAFADVRWVFRAGKMIYARVKATHGPAESRLEPLPPGVGAHTEARRR